MLAGKHILLGVTGGIAAYKTPSLVRLLKKEGAQVKVVMTPDAREFVAPLTLSVLSEHPVYWTFTQEESPDQGLWNNHVHLGRWADLLLIAPATANTLSKMANGACDNLLLAAYLSAECPVYFAPAMDLDMHEHPATQGTFEKLKEFGNIIIPSEHGELASGLVGPGRMAEPENIVAFLINDLKAKAPLYGKRYLVTAGPTFELIDPVRYIGNFSSGKMGYAIANAAARLGAEVVLVSGPTKDLSLHPSINKISTVTGSEMLEAVLGLYQAQDVVILCAAVADFKPKELHEHKIKSKTESFSIELSPTVDIAAYLGQEKLNQILVGFALETQDALIHAKSKLKKKNLDLIVLNSLEDRGVAFGADTNKITIIDRDENVQAYDLKSKDLVAEDIIEYIRNIKDA
ncbi:MAG TPA: bifunctional phosphopantothenoylcysteine decarboxylase/phosphopantothenate--cysteine ligase CoaBC [Flavobacteriaceae bacterium]|nr:bifunctional phosphopantothenoylcysteine decarboxylase/phosphopantothenate--cysteine ligase CoaBC [Flavobacteriaceae bacterium]